MHNNIKKRSMRSNRYKETNGATNGTDVSKGGRFLLVKFNNQGRIKSRPFHVRCLEVTSS